jgi:hypothetical protein
LKPDFKESLVSAPPDPILKKPSIALEISFAG